MLKAGESWMEYIVTGLWDTHHRLEAFQVIYLVVVLSEKRSIIPISQKIPGKSNDWQWWYREKDTLPKECTMSRHMTFSEFPDSCYHMSLQSRRRFWRAAFFLINWCCGSRLWAHIEVSISRKDRQVLIIWSELLVAHCRGYGAMDGFPVCDYQWKHTVHEEVRVPYLCLKTYRPSQVRRAYF